MKYDAVKTLLPANWAEGVLEKLNRKLRWEADEAAKADFIPYTTENGRWKPTAIDWWTNGFWGAQLWQMHLLTGDGFYRDAAVRAEEMMDAALRDFKRLHHDVGFMWLIQSGVRHAVERNADSFDRTLFAANMLAGRFNPSGFIRAWNGSDQQGWAIIDCMMNLPLLCWASRQTGDPRFELIARRHADTAMRHFVRPDGSCNHIVVFDPLTGAYLDNPAGQGYASGSCWSRGQAWALYGFTLMYLNTGDEAYLATAKKTADYFIAHLTPDGVPDCDFRQPADRVVKDNAAGAIAACGLMELGAIDPNPAYARAAAEMLTVMDSVCADWALDEPGILKLCTERYGRGEHIRMNYADYFLIEAVGKLLGQRVLAWRPDVRRP